MKPPQAYNITPETLLAALEVAMKDIKARSDIALAIRDALYRDEPWPPLTNCVTPDYLGEIVKALRLSTPPSQPASGDGA